MTKQALGNVPKTSVNIHLFALEQPATNTLKTTRRYKKSKWETKRYSKAFTVSQEDKIQLLWKALQQDKIPQFRHPISHFLLSPKSSWHCLKAALEDPQARDANELITQLYRQIARGDSCV